ncbi:MAG: hypothetical protein KC635_20965 [Myxococcales bacterium]|nr:hypothetical protein [Myxococcales bacterium]MCB9734242.1 hypothetical protein [Deltaproteobacteria bacterium]
MAALALAGGGACSRSEAPAAVPAVAPPCVPTTLTAPASEPAATAAPGATSPDDRPPEAAPKAGRLALRFEPTEHRKLDALTREVGGSDLLAQVTRDIDRAVALPKDVALVFADCGTDNAFYDDENATVTMCWELMGSMRDNMRREYRDPRDARDALYGAALFTLIHELGHAYVDLLDLPITGKEEDAVDQLATFMLVDSGDSGVEMALDGALSFVHDAEAEAQEAGEDAEPATWDEHATSEQRFFNVICWIYGSDPAAHSDLLESHGGALPDERADLCPDEWRRLSRAWTTLLAPFGR